MSAPLSPRGRRTPAGPAIVGAVVIAATAAVAGIAVAIHLGKVEGPRAPAGSGAPATSSPAPTTSRASVTWHSVTVPSGLTPTGISCVSSSDCWVLGVTDVSTNAPRSAVWNLSGTTWSRLSVPANGNLVAITCVTTDDCWAVGGHYTVPPDDNDGVVQPLIEHDSGTGFTITDIPQTTGDADNLEAVTCASEDDCWAVGSYAANSENGGDGLQHPLIEEYDGSGWRPIYVSGQPLNGDLRAVACVDAGDCWAVGSVVVGNDYAQLIEQYTGGGWTVVVGPDTEGTSAAGGLGAVTCTGPNDCWAVGSTNPPSTPTEETAQPLIEHYTGGAWTVVSSPFVNAANGGGLSGIACTSADACWAVGLAQGPLSDLMGTMPPNTVPPLFEQYTGARWSLVSGFPEGDALTAISCVPDGVCYAAGTGLVETTADS